MRFPLLIPLLLLFQLLCHASSALPLSTSSRWIVDENGWRVKLACVNWPSHLKPMVTEGLNKQPLDKISKKIAAMGFNCVRLTWALFMLTNDSLANLTVRQSFQNLGLEDSIAGLRVNNPSLLDLTVVQSFQAVVTNLGSNGVMVILDNHVSKPGWCCSSTDGNGFFGDVYFDPDVWISGLTKMASMFNDSSNVVGMSLRNELRGPRQNVTDWYRYMQKGAEAVHAANPDVLIILSGLYFDNDLSFLSDKQVELTFTGKLVFELHWYSFSNSKDWETGVVNQVCGRITNSVMQRAGFLVGKEWPLFVSEFGIDQRGTNMNDDRYISCFFGAAAEQDWDWALWTLQGSYYMREGTVEHDEPYGALGWDWCQPRNASFLQRISALQSPFRGPNISDGRTYKVIFHPLTGLCVLRKFFTDPLRLGPCGDSEPWNYTPQKTLVLKGTYFCLQAKGIGKPAKLGIICTGPNSKWELSSDSKMHLSTRLADDNTTVCLDVDSSNNLVTNPCFCLSNRTCDPSSQWFKIVDSTRPRSGKKIGNAAMTEPLRLPTSPSLDQLSCSAAEGRRAT
ncbi:hypothetical protein ACLOJK_009186 [Asimina triloba]